MTIKPTKNIYYAVAILFIVAIYTFFAWNVVFPGVIIMVTSLNYWISLGKTIVFEKAGCTISFLCFKKEYLWSDLKTKRIEEFSNSLEFRSNYTHGAIFSTKKIRRPKWLKPATYSLLHPFLFFFVYFEHENGTKAYSKLYEVNANEFKQKLHEWEVELDEL